MTSRSADRRLNKELKEITSKPIEGVTCGPVDGDMYNWEAVFTGPAGTGYEGGTFKMVIAFPEDYPFKGPMAKFNTKIYHPNFVKDGAE